MFFKVCPTWGSRNFLHTLACYKIAAQNRHISPSANICLKLSSPHCQLAKAAKTSKNIWYRAVYLLTALWSNYTNRLLKFLLWFPKEVLLRKLEQTNIAAKRIRTRLIIFRVFFLKSLFQTKTNLRFAIHAYFPKWLCIFKYRFLLLFAGVTFLRNLETANTKTI